VSDIQNRPAACLVAIPACNESERIESCLQALAASRDRPLPTIVLLTNNTTDGTGEVATKAAHRLGLRLHLHDVTLPPDQASAGAARRLAMQHAARLASPDAILITTDADGRVEPGWLDANLRAIEAGADAVCGMALIDPDEARAIPQILHDDDAREMIYAALLDELHHLLDPDPADLWPRHSEESGASIAVRRRAYERAGGIPPLATGEDRGFIRALRRVDARIRHAPDARVIVSGRLEGRAAGGMADTMRRRLLAQDEHIDDRLEPVADTVRRAKARALLRRSSYPLPAETFFGVLWEQHETRVGLTARRPVRRADLEAAIVQAREVRDALLDPTLSPPRPRLPDLPAIQADRADTSRLGAFPTG
jgi:GT2 family glycosyltransferase